MKNKRYISKFNIKEIMLLENDKEENVSEYPVVEGRNELEATEKTLKKMEDSIIYGRSNE